MPAERPSARSVLDATLGFRLSRLTRALRQDYARRLSPFGITPPQSALLRAVAESPECTLRALARRLASDPMATKRMADDLERRGLLRSESAPAGRRVRRISVTEVGKVLAEAASRLAAEQQADLAEALGSAGLDQLQGLVGRLESWLLDEGSPMARGRSSGAADEASL